MASMAEPPDFVDLTATIGVLTSLPSADDLTTNDHIDIEETTLSLWQKDYMLP